MAPALKVSPVSWNFREINLLDLVPKQNSHDWRQTWFRLDAFPCRNHLCHATWSQDPCLKHGWVLSNYTENSGKTSILKVITAFQRFWSILHRKEFSGLDRSGVLIKHLLPQSVTLSHTNKCCVCIFLSFLTLLCSNI